MKKELPSIIPVFPLSGVIYFPQTNLPLNIFEKRYLSLVMDTLKKDKLMGMIQAKKDGKDVLIESLSSICHFPPKHSDAIVLVIKILWSFRKSLIIIFFLIFKVGFP